MTFQHLFTKSAEKDVVSAFLWYQHKRHGLGDEFLLALEAEVNTICRNPRGFQLRHKTIRMVPLKRFPLGVHYIIDGNKVVITAILHFSRNPETIKKHIA